MKFLASLMVFIMTVYVSGLEGKSKEELATVYDTDAHLEIPIGSNLTMWSTEPITSFRQLDAGHLVTRVYHIVGNYRGPSVLHIEQRNIQFVAMQDADTWQILPYATHLEGVTSVKLEITAFHIIVAGFVHPVDSMVPVYIVLCVAISIMGCMCLCSCHYHCRAHTNRITMIDMFGI
jgi:hypothetical protein